MTPDQRSIIAAAEQSGMDPTFALAIAERESRFNPTAHSSKTIEGLYQMRGDNRAAYGVGDSIDPEVQTRGWTKFFRQNQYDMSKVLGRAPTDEEGYLGHHFGATRAARMLKMDPSTPIDQVFTPDEMAQNPHFGRAGTVGALNSSVLADVKQKHAKYQDAVPDFSGEAEGAADKPDLSSFGTPADASDGTGNINIPSPTTAPDFSDQGTPVDNPMMIKGPVQTLGIRG